MLKDLVDISENGHLDLCHRVSLLGSLNNYDIVNKIFLECAKKVYPLWQKEDINDGTVLPTLIGAQNCLYSQNVEKSSFLSLADLNQSKLMDHLSEGDKISAMAGLTTQSLAYSIAFDAGLMLNIDEYEGENDDVFDWEGWNPDFYASMTYSGGNPFKNEGSVELRKEFWTWYLDIVLNLSQAPDQPIIPIPLK